MTSRAISRAVARATGSSSGLPVFGGPTLKFTFATPDATTGEMQMQDVGTGTPVHTHTADILQPEESTVRPYYARFGANVEVYRGGRVVSNHVLYSEDLENAEWNLTNATVSGNKVTYSVPTNSQFRQNTNVYDALAGETVIASVTLSGVAGTKVILACRNPTGTELTDRTITLSATPTRYAVSHTLSGDSIRIGINIYVNGTLGVDAAEYVNIYEPQVEPSTGRVDVDTPSEYIPTASATVTKTFSTENGNSVTDGVVTEAVGSPLAQTPYLWYQPGPRTNDQVQSADIDPPEWTLITCTSALDAVGIEGVPNTATTLTATANAATAIAGAITDASDDQATQWFIKRKTGTGDIDISMDNGSTWTTVVIDSSFSEIVVDQAALANPEIGIRIATSGDEVIVANSSAFLGLTAEEVNGLGPIVTTGASAATDKTVLEYPEANIADTFGVVYLEFYSFQGGGAIVNATSRPRVLSFGTGGRLLSINAGTGQVQTYDGTNEAKSTGPMSVGANKMAIVYTDTQQQVCLNGIWGTLAAFVGSWSRPSDLEAGLLADFCFGIRNGKHYSGIADLAAGKAIVDELMA